MAILKFGSIVTEGSGSLGGQTIQHSQGGFQLRTKPIPHGNPSASQILIRSINQQLQVGWRALTPAQQQIWNLWTYTHSIMNAKGEKHTLSGHSLWMKCQYYRRISGFSFITDPAQAFYYIQTLTIGLQWMLVTPYCIPGSGFIDFFYSVNQYCAFYSILINVNYLPVPPNPQPPPPTSQDIKNASLAGPLGGRISTWHFIIDHPAMPVISSIRAINQIGGNIPLIPNHDYTFYFVLQSESGILQPAPIRVYLKTLP